MTMFPLAPDQTIAQMWSNGVWGGATFWVCTENWAISQPHKMILGITYELLYCS